MNPGSVFIVSSKAEFAGEIASYMVNNGFCSVEYALSANEARRRLNLLEPDLIIVSTPLPDDNGCDFVLDTTEITDAGIIVLSKYEFLGDMQFRLEKTGALLLPKPISRATLLQTARFAIETRKSILALKNERDLLYKKAQERKIIEKAKWLLVEKLHMNEAQAHKYIQKLAMDKRMMQVKVAEEIITTYEKREDGR